MIYLNHFPAINFGLIIAQLVILIATCIPVWLLWVRVTRSVVLPYVCSVCGKPVLCPRCDPKGEVVKWKKGDVD